MHLYAWEDADVSVSEENTSSAAKVREQQFEQLGQLEQLESLGQLGLWVVAGAGSDVHPSDESGRLEHPKSNLS